MTTETPTQRRAKNRRKGDHQVVRVELKDGMGRSRWITADLVDVSEGGVCLSVMTPLNVDQRVMVRGGFLSQNGRGEHRDMNPMCVRWCMDSLGGAFRVGLEFEDGQSNQQSEKREAVQIEPDEIDCYEFMELSPNASRETIDRVYRMLAQRYHPDNSETGNADMFVQLAEVYRTLSDPERRAAYDARYRSMKRLQWKIFDQSETSRSRVGEKRKRQGILGLLYSKTLHDPDRGSMSVLEMEELLGCPREHLESALWFLRGKGHIARGDNARYTITVDGFEAYENADADQSPDPARKMIAN